MLKILTILLLANSFGFINQNDKQGKSHLAFATNLLRYNIGENIMQPETFKPIKDYEGLYEVSNYGRVKSLEKRVKNGVGYRTVRERILKLAIEDGYYFVKLSENSKAKNCRIHQLVWDTFGDRQRNGRTLQVDHIDSNKLNNRIDNLQLLSNRENSSKGWLQRETTSKYTGVSWNKNSKKWGVAIHANGIHKYLGTFINELEASEVYQKALRQLRTS